MPTNHYTVDVKVIRRNCFDVSGEDMTKEEAEELVRKRVEYGDHYYPDVEPVYPTDGEEIEVEAELTEVTDE